MACKKFDPHEMCEECPEWIFTLADLIMCMMGLFVLLWVLKPSGNPATAAKEQEAQIEQIAAIRDAFGYVPDPNSNDPVDKWLLRHLSPNNGPGDGAKTDLPQKSMKGPNEDSSTIRPGNISAVGGRIAFEKSDSTLSATTQSNLDEVAELIRGHRNIILIRGHASLDDLGETSTPQQRMDLSLRRAQAAADYLVSKGVEPEILRVQGCSTFEPVSRGRYTPEAQTLNRRVEVEATASLVEERQDNSNTSSPAASSASTADHH